MADKDLEFRIGFDSINTDNIDELWKKHEKDIQDKINKASKIQIPINDIAVKNLNEQLRVTQNLLKSITKEQNVSGRRTPTLLQTTKAQGIADINAIRAAKEKAIADDKVALSSLKRAQAESKAAQATKANTTSLVSQRGVLNGMPQLLNSYLSILGGARILNNIRQITSEFELQKVSLGAITKDLEFTEQLWTKIKASAIASPFTVKELTTFTKQLSAYRIENEVLFNTMSKLADVSAGLGIGMDRLTLAYGQVKAASVLRGTELRQFTEAGIPLVDLLAKKFSQLNGEMVTTGDVFELISKRAVSFEMVDEIFDDMTKAGGTFYQMQKKQAESLYGIWANVPDNIQLAFDKLGRDNRGFLMGVGKGLTTLFQNFDMVVDTLKKVTIGYGAYRVSVLLASTAIGQDTKAILANELATKKANATKLIQESVLRKLNDEELRTIATMSALSFADKKRLVEGGRLNTIMLQRMFVTGKLSRVEMLRLGVLSGMSIAEAKAFASMSAYTRALKFATLTAKGFLVAIKATAVALLTNPITWVLAIGALASHFYRASQEAKAFKKELDSIASSKALDFTKEEERLKTLVSQLGKANKGSEEFNSILAEISNTFGVYLPQLDTASDKYEYLSSNIDKVTVALRNQKIQSALAEGMGKIDEKFGEDLNELKNNIVSTLIDVKRLSEASANDLANGIIEGLEEGLERGDKLTRDKIFSLYQQEISKIDFKFPHLESPYDAIMKNAIKYYDILTSKQKESNSLMTSVTSTFKVSDESTAKILEFEKASIRANEALNNSIENIRKNVGLSNVDKEFQIRAAKIETYTKLLEQYSKELPKSTNKIKSDLEALMFATKGTAGVINKYVQSIGNLSQAQRDFYKVKPDESSANYFERMNKLIDDNNEKIADNKGNIQALEAIKLSDPKHIASLYTENSQLSEQNRIIISLLEMWGRYSGSKSKATVEDPLKAQLDTLKSAYKEYEDLQKLMSKDGAKKQVKAIYGLEIDDASYRSSLEKIQKQYEQLGKKAKAANVGNAIFEFDANQVERKIKGELDRIKDLIEKESKAQDFYEKILGFTGDKDLAQKLTLGVSLVDFNVDNRIREQLIDNLQKTAKDLKIDTNIVVDGEVDTSKIKKLLEGMDLGSEQKKILEESFNALAEYDTKSLTTLFSSLDKYEDVEKQKTKIVQENEELRKKAREQGLDSLIKGIDKKEKAELDMVDLEKFKKDVNWETLFGNLDKVPTLGISSIIPQIETMKNQLKDTAPITAIKELEQAIQKLKEEFIERDPFLAIKVGWTQMIEGIKEYSETKKIFDPLNQKLKTEGLTEEETVKYNELVEKLKTSAMEAVGGIKSLTQGFSKLSNKMQQMESGINNIADFFEEILGDNEFSNVLKDLAKGFGIMASVLSLVATGFSIATVAAAVFGTTVNTLMPYMWILVAVAAAIGAIFSALNAKTRALEKQQDRLKDKIKRLSDTFDDLSRSMDKALGDEKLEYHRDMIKNIEERKKATQELIGLEKQKKKQDKDDLYEWERDLVKLNQQIEDSIEKMQEYFLGSNLTTAAEEFADSWLDAYLSFEDTKTALESSFKDMLKNLIVKSVLAKTMEKALSGVFERAAGYIEGKVGLDDLLTEIDLTMGKIPQLDTMLRSLYERLGINLQQAGTLGGMALGISQASEDAINAVTGAVNTAVYYLAVIYEKMFAENSTQTTLNNLITIQNSALAELRAIKENTSRSANAAEGIYDILDSVTKDGGIKKINTNI